jgi:hypothetical protein
MTQQKRLALYHSQLVKATQDGPVALTIDTQLQQSQNPAKCPHGFLGVTMDNQGYWLNAENQTIAGALALCKKGGIYYVEAKGSRASASMTVMDSQPEAAAGNLPAATPVAAVQIPVGVPQINGQTVGMAMKEAVAIANTSYEVGSPEWITCIEMNSKKLMAISLRLQALDPTTLERALVPEQPDVPF